MTSTESHSVVSRPAVFCGLLYVAAFLALAVVLRHHSGFPLDDSWIHQTIARNLAETHVLGFTRGHLSSGSTSLLWTLILAAGRICFPSLSQVLYCLCLNALFLFGIGYLFKEITELDGLDPRSSWIMALAPALSGNFLWFGVIGMEHLLFILLTLAVVRAWFGPAVQSLHRLPWSLPLLTGLLVVTRPEGIALALMLGAATHSFRRSFRAWAFAVAGGAVGLAISAAVNWKTSGRLVPQTLQGRQFLAGPHPGVAGRLVFLGQFFARILKTWSILASNSLLHGRGLLAGAAVLVLLILLLAVGIRALLRLRARRSLLLTVWALVTLAMYCMVLPNTGHGGRYIAITLMMCLALMYLGLEQGLALAFKDKNKDKAQRVVSAAVVLAMVATAIISIRTWRTVTAAGVDQINAEHGAMATWIEQNLPADGIVSQQVAAYDIGRIGYQFNGNLVDLGGLVDPRYMLFLFSGRTATYLEERGVRWVVLPTQTSGDGYWATLLSLDPAHGVRLSPIHTVCADKQQARLAMAAMAAAYTCQSLYRIGYPPGQP